MKKIVNIIKKNSKLYVGVIAGIIVSISIYGVYGASTLTASSINIDTTKMPNIGVNKNLNDALDYLYDKAQINNTITIESGVIHENQTYLGIVYLDPTDLTIKCTAANSTSNVEQKTGCMKWYIYKKNADGTYQAILDHNIKERQAWNTDKDVTQYGTNVPYENSLVYPVVQLLTKTTEEDENGSNWDTSLNPRLITAYEVAEITGKTGFTNTSAHFYLDSKNQNRTNTSQGTSNYAWLFDNLGWNDQYGDCTNYGCNYSNTTNSAVYWTSTPYSTAGAGSIVWRVDRYGYLDHHIACSTSYGVRPVITIAKSSL